MAADPAFWTGLGAGDGPLLMVGNPIVGWRVWRYRNGVLRSLYKAADWPLAGPLEAKCLYEGMRFGSPFSAAYGWKGPPPEQGPPPEHECPSPADLPAHECGIFAAKEPRKVRSYASHIGVLGHPTGETRVVGIVGLWGRIWRHEAGFRAQFARPQELWVSPGLPVEEPDDVAALLVDGYGVPVYVEEPPWDV